MSLVLLQQPMIRSVLQWAGNNQHQLHHHQRLRQLYLLNFFCDVGHSLHKSTNVSFITCRNVEVELGNVCEYCPYIIDMGYRQTSTPFVGNIMSQRFPKLPWTALSPTGHTTC
jgi:hypothetical protein